MEDPSFSKCGGHQGVGNVRPLRDFGRGIDQDVLAREQAHLGVVVARTSLVARSWVIRAERLNVASLRTSYQAIGCGFYHRRVQDAVTKVCKDGRSCFLEQNLLPPLLKRRQKEPGARRDRPE